MDMVTRTIRDLPTDHPSELALTRKLFFIMTVLQHRVPWDQ